MRVLCVAEKPAIARAISQALGGGSVTTRQSGSRYIRNFDVAYNFPGWGPCEVTVTAVLGHLTELRFPPPFDKWSTAPLQLFHAPVSVVVEAKEVARNITNESRRADILYIWTDCDREGEHIGGEIAEQARKVNPRIKVWRAAFNNVDPQHLRQAAGRPQPLDQQQIDAVAVRRELDLRTGFSMTRFQTNLLKQKFRVIRDREQVVSYGSCQFPTLGFVVDRYLRVKNHRPEPFWSIALNVKAPGNQQLKPTWDRGHIFDHMTATVLFERALEIGGKIANVTDVSTKPTSRFRPLPLTTVTLQKTGTAKLGMSSKKIMDVAEKLYNKGFISYPRTETDKYPADMDLRGLIDRQSANNEYSAYVHKLSREGCYKTPREGKHDDKAHPPIHPIRAVAGSSADMTPDERKVYDFVARSFLACCSQDAKGLSTTITIEWGGEKFRISGDRVTDPGFLEIYPFQLWTGTKLPEIRNGQELEVVSAILRESETSPPKPLTEPELIALMDSNGIGTDATMADHIQRIQDREFVRKERTYFYPTTLGIALVQAYDTIGLEKSLTKPQLRRDTEEAVTRVAHGQSPRAAVMSQLIAQYEQVFRHANSNKATILAEAGKYLATPQIEA